MAVLSDLLSPNNLVTDQDVPMNDLAGNGGKVLVVNVGETAAEWGSEIPAVTGKANQVLTVNDAGTDWEWQPAETSVNYTAVGAITAGDPVSYVSNGTTCETTTGTLYTDNYGTWQSSALGTDASYATYAVGNGYVLVVYTRASDIKYKVGVITADEQTQTITWKSEQSAPFTGTSSIYQGSCYGGGRHVFIIRSSDGNYYLSGAEISNGGDTVTWNTPYNMGSTLSYDPDITYHYSNRYFAVVYNASNNTYIQGFDLNATTIVAGTAVLCNGTNTKRNCGIGSNNSTIGLAVYLDISTNAFYARRYTISGTTISLSGSEVNFDNNAGDWDSSDVVYIPSPYNYFTVRYSDDNLHRSHYLMNFDTSATPNTYGPTSMPDGQWLYHSQGDTHACWDTREGRLVIFAEDDVPSDLWGIKQGTPGATYNAAWTWETFYTLGAVSTGNARHCGFDDLTDKVVVAYTAIGNDSHYTTVFRSEYITTNANKFIGYALDTVADTETVRISTDGHQATVSGVTSSINYWINYDGTLITSQHEDGYPVAGHGIATNELLVGIHP